ncbi:MAG: hypothetical protein ACSHX7_07740, partial [Luteolibacter sp.]
MSDEPQNPLEGLLSDFSLGPAWARGKSEPKKNYSQETGEREYKPRKGGGNQFRGNNRGNDRRQQGGGGNRRGSDRNNRDRNFQPREQIAPAEGVNVTLLPDKTSIQAICKEIHQVARVYPLFDVAEIILAERARSLAVFEISEKKPEFYRCKIEEALFLTKEEAVQHILQADWRTRFIEESTIEVNPPKGSFQSVAKCGISGEWLGPPNFHAYQTNIRRIHRQRFSNMPFEAYTSKIRTERGEEAVNEWLESMKVQTRWRILSKEELKAQRAAEAAVKSAAEAPKAPEPELSTGRDADPSASASDAPESSQVTEPSTDAVTDSVEAVVEKIEEIVEAAAPVVEDLLPATTEAAEPSETTEAPANEATTEKEENKPEQASAPEPTWFTDRAELERVLITEVLNRAFHTTRKAKVSAAITGKNLSPGLLVRLKGTGNHHRKHPAIIIPAVCRVLESEHMPVFKRKGKLFTGPARPQHLAADAVLATRPAEMVKWIRENTPAKLEGLWKAVLPEEATAPPAEYAADLFWLLQQGHILLYTDDTLVVQEAPKPQQPKKKKAKPAPQEKPAPDSEPAKDADPLATTSDSPAAEEKPATTEQNSSDPKTGRDADP